MSECRRRTKVSWNIGIHPETHYLVQIHPNKKFDFHMSINWQVTQSMGSRGLASFAKFDLRNTNAVQLIKLRNNSISLHLQSETIGSLHYD